ncbi:DinB family protein [Kitasatospora sp. GAS204B]|uniref:DinB family protein n=1 Tax=unclassified Kitasatospora TaxID=2633591 RepID=UPI002475230E|nr:DinB family protein [Kitasatospora sp. GAS204B]MDH6118078.1 putative damage-inducible protein DinB [Kitasatospora sp. GAS204B]
MTTTENPITGEHADLLATLDKHRNFLRHTTKGLTDEQAALTPTVSALCLGGLIKHVTQVERRWFDFTQRGAEAMSGGFEEHMAGFRMEPGETLAGLLAAYDDAAKRTDAMLTSLADLNESHPLPKAPWFEPGASWSVRRVMLHVIAETSQHAGHADIIREAIDGQKTMG